MSEYADVFDVDNPPFFNFNLCFGFTTAPPSVFLFVLVKLFLALSNSSTMPCFNGKD